MNGRLIVATCCRCDYSFASKDPTAVALWRDDHDQECPAPRVFVTHEHAA